MKVTGAGIKLLWKIITERADELEKRDNGADNGGANNSRTD